MSDRRRFFDRRKLPLVAILVVVVIGSWWFTRDVTPPEDLPDVQAKHDPDYIIEKFTATAMNESGVPRYVLSATRLIHYPDDDTAHLADPVLVQHQADGTQTTTRSDAAVMPGDGSEIVMLGNVHGKRSGISAGVSGDLRSETLRIQLDGR